jgi:hypothetical protein
MTLARRLMPRGCSANGKTVVLPPAIAARVPEKKSSAIFRPAAAGWARCTWLSMPPGITIRPDASISRDAPAMRSAMAAMRPSRTAMSAR